MFFQQAAISLSVTFSTLTVLLGGQKLSRVFARVHNLSHVHFAKTLLEGAAEEKNTEIK